MTAGFHFLYILPKASNTSERVINVQQALALYAGIERSLKMAVSYKELGLVNTKEMFKKAMAGSKI